MLKLPSKKNVPFTYSDFVDGVHLISFVPFTQSYAVAGNRLTVPRLWLSVVSLSKNGVGTPLPVWQRCRGRGPGFAVEYAFARLSGGICGVTVSRVVAELA